MGLIFAFFYVSDLVDSCLARSVRRGGVLELLRAARRSGVARRGKRHHSNGDDSNAAKSNDIATAVARGSWQRRLGILPQQRL